MVKYLKKWIRIKIFKEIYPILYPTNQKALNWKYDSWGELV